MYGSTRLMQRTLLAAALAFALGAPVQAGAFTQIISCSVGNCAGSKCRVQCSGRVVGVLGCKGSWFVNGIFVRSDHDGFCPPPLQTSLALACIVGGSMTVALKGEDNCDQVGNCLRDIGTPVTTVSCQPGGGPAHSMEPESDRLEKPRPSADERADRLRP